MRINQKNIKLLKIWIYLLINTIITPKNDYKYKKQANRLVFIICIHKLAGNFDKLNIK